MGEEVTLLLELLKSTDLDTALTVFLAGAFVAGGKYLIKKLPSIIEEVISLHTDGPYISKERPDLPVLVSLNTEFSDNMNAFIRNLGCSRALIFQYHNGDKLLSGLDYIKATCSHEFLNPKSVTAPLCPVQKDYINVPISFFEYFLRELTNNNGTFTQEVNARFKNINPAMNDFFTRYGISAIICSELKDSQNYPYGFIMFEFHSSEKRSYKKLKDSVIDYVPRIESMLDSMSIVRSHEENRTRIK